MIEGLIEAVVQVLEMGASVALYSLPRSNSQYSNVMNYNPNSAWSLPKTTIPISNQSSGTSPISRGPIKERIICLHSQGTKTVLRA